MRSMYAASGPRPTREFASVCRSPVISSGLIFDFRVMEGPLFPCGPDRTHRKSADKPLKACQALVNNHHTLRSDFILADILGMISATHLDNGHNLAKPVIDRYIPEPDDVIAKERDRVGAEWKFGKGLIHFNGAYDRHPDSRQCEDHPVERFAKVGAEAGRKSHFKARQRIDHQPPGPDLLDGVEY